MGWNEGSTLRYVCVIKRVGCDVVGVGRGQHIRLVGACNPLSHTLAPLPPQERAFGP